jgi:Helix-turn-helix domain
MKQQGVSVRAMARALGRPASSVSRELARNTCPVRGYASVHAQAVSSSRRAAARPPHKPDPQGALWRIVLSLLDWKWSPQQISGTLKRMWPDDPSMRVSHETIYNAIYDALARFRSSDGWTVAGDASVALVKVGANGLVDTMTAAAAVEVIVMTSAGLMAEFRSPVRKSHR